VTDVQIAVEIEVALSARSGCDRVKWRRRRQSDQVAREPAGSADEIARQMEHPIIAGNRVRAIGSDEQVEHDRIARLGNNCRLRIRAVNAHVHDEQRNISKCTAHGGHYLGA
jgi:hypothetical protein